METFPDDQLGTFLTEVWVVSESGIECEKIPGRRYHYRRSYREWKDDEVDKRLGQLIYITIDIEYFLFFFFLFPARKKRVALAANQNTFMTV
jgi:hypothetical protein